MDVTVNKPIFVNLQIQQQKMLEFIRQPWPWYVAGPLIGLMVPLLLIVGNKHFGVSQSLRHFCAMCIPTKLPYFNYNWREYTWNLLFVLGLVIGGALSALFLQNPDNIVLSEAAIETQSKLGITDFQGLIPKEIFAWEKLGEPVTLIFLVIGGFVIGFGTRYADGCTSGHAIMGMSLLSPASLVAVIGFFVGGLISTYLIIPYLLQL